jgi:hypothetical protein
MSNKKYITRTFRIPKEYDNILRDEANEIGQSVNSIIDSILSKYVNNDRFYKDSQLLSLTPRTISSLLTMLSDVEVVRAGKLAGSTSASDNLLMRGMSLDFESVKWFIEEIMSKYADWFNCNYHMMNNMHMFHMRHGLGKKWSIFLQAYLEEMVKTILSLDVEAMISENTVTLRIPIDGVK